MGASVRGEARRPLAGRRRLSLALLLMAAASLYLAVATRAEGPTIEAGESGGYLAWKPSTATVETGGTVAFVNATAVPHGVSWKSGPEAPSCSGVPIDGEGTNWSGSCAFAQAGTYAFVCPVHPTEMKGSVDVGSPGTTPTNPPPPAGESTESPLAGKPSQALRIAKSQRGISVRGSIGLSQASVGGRLQVELLARRAALSGPGHAGTLRVGRLVRSPQRAGRIPFAVALKRAARGALHRDGRLPLSVKVVVKPARGAALTLKRGVVLHG